MKKIIGVLFVSSVLLSACGPTPPRRRVVRVRTQPVVVRRGIQRPARRVPARRVPVRRASVRHARPGR